ncbi:MAG: SurA N-terminal domain-containing protein [Planctomycetes bacterium]|nr:SurA N-terminal domain-containing protein [Planctomycetota bacterium]MCC7169675.1 SurA N-terminal domain-containing protein [Planctomycetota bacterium]
MIAVVLSACIHVAALQAPQLADDAIARVGEATIPRQEFETFVAREHRATEFAEQALDDLISEQIVFLEAERRGLSVTDEQVTARFATYEREFEKSAREAGAKDLTSYLAANHIDLGLFRSKLRPVLLLERLVRAEFELDDDDPVPQEKMHVWIGDRMARARIDRTEVDTGIAARVDGVPIDLTRLGRRLVEASQRKKQDEWLDELIGCYVVEQAAARQGLILTDRDVDAGLDQWEKEYRERQRNADVDLRRLLAEKGLSIEALRTSRLFRAKLLMEKLVDDLYPDPELRAFFGAHRAEFNERAGRTVTMRVIFLKAGAPGAVEAKFVPRGYDEAKRILDEKLTALHAGTTTFGDVAKAISEHPSAAQDGNVGQLVAAARTPLGAIAQKALAARDERPGLAGPLEATEGVYLVELLDVQAAPGYEQLATMVRARAREDLFKTLKDGAGVVRRSVGP